MPGASDAHEKLKRRRRRIAAALALAYPTAAGIAYFTGAHVGAQVGATAPGTAPGEAIALMPERPIAADRAGAEPAPAIARYLGDHDPCEKTEAILTGALGEAEAIIIEGDLFADLTDIVRLGPSDCGARSGVARAEAALPPPAEKQAASQSRAREAIKGVDRPQRAIGGAVFAARSGAGGGEPGAGDGPPGVPVGDSGPVVFAGGMVGAVGRGGAGRPAPGAENVGDLPGDNGNAENVSVDSLNAGDGDGGAGSDLGPSGGVDGATAEAGGGEGASAASGNQDGGGSPIELGGSLSDQVSGQILNSGGGGGAGGAEAGGGGYGPPMATPVVETPLPGAMWLMLAGLAGLRAAGRGKG